MGWLRLRRVWVVPQGHEGRVETGAVGAKFLQRQDEGKESPHFSVSCTSPPSPLAHHLIPIPRRCQSPQRPPPPTAHGSLAAAALLPSTALDHEWQPSVGLPIPQTPGRGSQPWIISPAARCACVCACVCVCACAYVCGVRIWQTVPLLALSLLYLINVIYSWSSVLAGEVPSPELAMVAAQPPFFWL